MDISGSVWQAVKSLLDVLRTPVLNGLERPSGNIPRTEVVLDLVPRSVRTVTRSSEEALKSAVFRAWFAPNSDKKGVAFELRLCIVAALQCILVVKFGSPLQLLGS